MAMNDQDADKPRVHIPEEVSWMFIVIPFVVGIILVLAVLVYRCRATRNDRRLQRQAAREREQELFQLKVSRELENGDVPEWVDPHGARYAGLGDDYYMSAYKKLLAI